MNNINVGDIVGRISYSKDIYFIVDKIIRTSFNNEYAILKGLNIRIIADSPVDDLELISRNDVLKSIKLSELSIEESIKKAKDKVLSTLKRQKIYTGKILHIDGDRKYSDKSLKYYNKAGLNAIVKNIPEYRQSKVVIPLLSKYNPDILIITGHDAMLKSNSNFNNIYNYRNSRPFHKYSKRSKKMGSKFRKTCYICRCMSKFL